jgi:hypothetical protein
MLAVFTLRFRPSRHARWLRMVRGGRDLMPRRSGRQGLSLIERGSFGWGERYHECPRGVRKNTSASAR